MNEQVASICAQLGRLLANQANPEVTEGACPEIP